MLSTSNLMRDVVHIKLDERCCPHNVKQLELFTTFINFSSVKWHKALIKWHKALMRKFLYSEMYYICTQINNFQLFNILIRYDLPNNKNGYFILYGGGIC